MEGRYSQHSLRYFACLTLFATFFKCYTTFANVDGIWISLSDADGVPAKQVEHFRSALQNDRHAGEEERAQMERHADSDATGRVIQ